MSRTAVFQTAAALFVFGGLQIGFGGDEASKPGAKTGAGNKPLTKVYFGVDACRECHGKDKEVPPDKALYYRGTEVSIWDEHDKHKDATSVLLGERSRQMAKILGYKKRLTEEPRCVNCHGVYIEEGAEVHAESYGTVQQREKSGVSCVACHGAVAEWVNEHGKILATKGKSWKDLSPARKEREFGLRNLWDPATRAELCCSCHVGNAAQGKVVTHEMYAAGHPPLPGIEIVAFGEAMPRHWRTFSEKVAARPDFKNRFKMNKSYDADRDGLEQTRMATIGAVVAFRQSLRLVAAQARTSQHDAAEKQVHAGQSEGRSWPELAAFDCYACHHDLKKDSWRQKRGYTGMPGRPALRPWPMTLLELGLQQMESSGRQKQQRAILDQHMKALRATFDAQPFGEPAKLASTAAKLDTWTGALIEELKSRPFDRVSCGKSINALLALPEHQTLDFDSARQVGWAFQTLLADVDPGKLKEAEWKASLKTLESRLKLDLIKGQKQIVPDFLNETLGRIAEYDPDQFASLMKKIAIQYKTKTQQPAAGPTSP